MNLWVNDNMKKTEREARSSEGEVKVFVVKENWEPAEEYQEKLKSKAPVIHNLCQWFQIIQEFVTKSGRLSFESLLREQ